jgi:hypothetical protein
MYVAARSIAAVAQLVEQRIRNAKVGGSTPLSGTIHKIGFLPSPRGERPVSLSRLMS